MSTTSHAPRAARPLAAYRNKVLVGDALATLRRIPTASIHCCVTSPPYFRLRDYHHQDQIGQERTVERYVDRLVDVFDEVDRVLRQDGVLWLNLADTYGDDKGLMGIPARVADALRQHGWTVRCEVVLLKAAPYPESARDRPSRDHEALFMMTKSRHYYYDEVAAREASADWERGGGKMGPRRVGGRRAEHFQESRPGIYVAKPYRNPRTTWKVPPTRTTGTGVEHYARMSPVIPRRCIIWSTSYAGCCAACGAAWERVWEDDGPLTITVGWAPTCTCAAGPPVPCLVLDPFAGSGTTLAVARELGRDYLGVELNPRYVDLAKANLAGTTRGVDLDPGLRWGTLDR